MAANAVIRYDSRSKSLLDPASQPPLPADWFEAAPRDALCAELSRLSYIPFEYDPTILLGALRALRLRDFAPFIHAESDTQAFGCVGDDRTVYVVFRGTRSDALVDLIKDAFALPGGRGDRRHCLRHHGREAGRWVHAGFSSAYQGVKPMIDQWPELTRASTVVATGHSLGAALATLYAADRSDARLVTFGSPRVGNAAFAGTFACRNVARYRDCSDIVTRVPFEWMGYRHIEAPRFIDHEGNVLASPPSDDIIRVEMHEAKRDFRAFYRWQHSSVYFRSLADHAPINYVSALLGCRGR